MPSTINDSSPAYYAKAITPSDTDDDGFRALYVGGTGNVALVMVDGNVVTFNAVSGVLPVTGRRVNATGTTATGIVGLN